MPTSKSGLEGPADYNGAGGPSKEEMNAPTTNYPGSSKLEPKKSGLIEGPAESGYQGHGGRGKK